MPQLPVVDRAKMDVRRSRLTLLLERRDDFGLALVLIVATVVVISLGQGRLGQIMSVTLSGFTLLFVLHTSGAQHRVFRAAARGGRSRRWWCGPRPARRRRVRRGRRQPHRAHARLLRTVGDPRRILRSPVITVRLVLGALADLPARRIGVLVPVPPRRLRHRDAVLRPDADTERHRLRLLQLRHLDDGGLRRLHGRDIDGTDDRGAPKR